MRIGGSRRRDERGLAALEFVLIAPALLTLIFAVIQFALWYYAGSVARAAAREGANAGAEAPLDPGAAARKAQAVANGPGGGVVRNVGVQVGTSGDEAITVVVTGNAPSLVLGVSLPVRATGTAPLEVFRPESQQ
jgi:Flp pilus assembly protein TadG